MRAAAPASGSRPSGAARVERIGVGAALVRLVPFTWRDGRIELSLAWPHVVAVGVVILVLLCTAYGLGGRASGTAKPAESLKDIGIPVQNGQWAGQPPKQAHDAESAKPEPARSRTPDPEPTRPPAPDPEPLRPRGGGATTPLTVGAPTAGELAESPAPPPVEEAKPAAPEPERAFEFVSGQWYVLVQYFPKSRGAAAKQARDFLDARGISAYVEDRRADLALYATEAFGDSRKAQSLAERIKHLGRDYAPIGGYDFGQSQPIKR